MPRLTMAKRTPDITHKIMSSIKSKDTRPELLLRRALWAKGLRYKLHVNTLPGKPDIVFSRQKVAVFCDGDFWHGHNWVVRGLNSLDDELSLYTQFWRDKITKNIERDEAVNCSLRDMGWSVIRIWESEINSNVNACVNHVIDTLQHKIRIGTGST